MITAATEASTLVSWSRHELCLTVAQPANTAIVAHGRDLVGGMHLHLPMQLAAASDSFALSHACHQWCRPVFDLAQMLAISIPAQRALSLDEMQTHNIRKQHAMH